MEDNETLNNQELVETGQVEGQVDSAATEEQETQEAQTATAEQAGTQESNVQGDVPFHQHPRWQEVQQEREQLRQQNAQLLELLQKQQTPQTPSQQVQTQRRIDSLIDTAPDPQTKEFWRSMADIIREELGQGISEKEKLFKQEVGHLRGILSSMQLSDFRKQFPDVKAGSKEEKEIAGLIQAGLPRNKAYFAVMGEEAVKLAEERGAKKVQQKVHQKRQANTENSPGVALTAPQGQDRTFRESAEQIYDRMEREGKFK
jgi:hypothetical protein